MIGYAALNEGSNTITLTTAPTEGKEVIAVLRDTSSGEMQEYTSAPITVTASEGSSGGETTKPTQAEILAGCEVTIDGFSGGKITEDATSLTANVKLHSSVKSLSLIHICCVPLQRKASNTIPIFAVGWAECCSVVRKR